MQIVGAVGGQVHILTITGSFFILHRRKRNISWWQSGFLRIGRAGHCGMVKGIA